MAKSLTDLRKLARSQLKSITKEELIESIMAPDHNEDLLRSLNDKITSLSGEVADLKGFLTSPGSEINQKLTKMQQEIDKQAEFIARQHQFLEQLDRKERENHLIVLGVPDGEEALDGETSDEEKLRKIWTQMGVPSDIVSHRRLGRLDAQQGGSRKRPILVVVTTKYVRDDVLANSRKLKDSSSQYNRIYVKKDVHPSVRNEWKRLRDAERTEKDRPENVGCVIRLDVRERKLYRDDVVIDKWNPLFF